MKKEHNIFIRRIYPYSGFFIGLLCLIWSSESLYGHARFKVGSKVSPPRNASTGLKTGPCGDAPRTSTPIEYKSGQKIRVEFEETVNHLGFFEIYFLSRGDTLGPGSLAAPLAKVIDDQNGNILDGIAHQFAAEITLPAIECIDCALQLVQVMQDFGPNGPSSRYFSCSDISLKKDKSDAVNPPDQAPSPTPNNQDTNKTLTPTKPEKPSNLNLRNAGGAP